MASGGHEITRMEAPEISLAPAEQVLQRWRSRMNDLRLKSQLTDVRFVCDDGNELAHRNVLIVASDHFLSVFTGDFDEGSPSKSAANPADVRLGDVPIACVRHFLGECHRKLRRRSVRC